MTAVKRSPLAAVQIFGCQFGFRAVGLVATAAPASLIVG